MPAFDEYHRVTFRQRSAFFADPVAALAAIHYHVRLKPYTESGAAMTFSRITQDPAVMGGMPCIRGLRVTVGTVLGLLADGGPRDRVLAAYPYLEPADLDEAVAYAAWRMEECEAAFVA